MAKLYNAYEHPKEYKKRHSGSDRRFYPNLEMSIIKHDQAVQNSQKKRGEVETAGNGFIYICGCGCRGCFLHRDYKGSTNQAGVDLLSKIMSNAKKILSSKKDDANDYVIRKAGFDSKTSFRR
jgi:hypothetical protein